jgi:hypothetical protein
MHLSLTVVLLGLVGFVSSYGLLPVSTGSRVGAICRFRSKIFSAGTRHFG